jgi:hypothetical protein
MTRLARRFSGALVAVFVIAGLAGLEAWPITGWKLFSLARDATQTRWEVEVADSRGRAVALDLDDLPMAFRQAEWLLVGLPGATPSARDELCAGLLRGATEAVPEASGLRIVRDRQRQVRHHGDWIVDHDREIFHTCERAGR